MTNYLIITGGSKGIGAATIARFKEENWQVLNISRTPSLIPDVKNISIDLTSANNILPKAQEIKNYIKQPTKICVVHNAIFYKPDHLTTLAVEDLTKALQINIVSPVVLNQILIPLMGKGSAIIYIGSSLAEKAVMGNASHTISKHAVVGMMRVTCQDLMDKGIHTLCINPGLVDTKLLKDTMPSETVDFLLKNKVIGKRLIQPKEIAEVIYFFATTNLVNGTCIAANTGEVEA